MQIFVRANGASTVATVNAASTIAEVKAQCNISGDVHLTASGKIVEDSMIAGDCLSEEAVLEVNEDLLGAGKKRKKKTYTKPKKIKHKHKKVKLGVLKFYKVDGNDKVQRLRKECPKCGPGVFMAMHHDRYYCGKCTLTYVFKEREE